jgi:recombination protein U
MLAVMKLLNYPNGKAVTSSMTNNSYANRGMSLEYDINLSNDFYLSTNRAVIHKKPTPLQIVKVDYQRRSAAKITEAYFKVPSTTDYNGLYRGLYLDFEAKETKAKQSFSLALLHQHQFDHLQRIIDHRGLAFVIIRFTLLDETYLVMAEHIIRFRKANTRQSLPLSWIREHGQLIRQSLNPRMDYLSVIDQIIKGEHQ